MEIENEFNFLIRDYGLKYSYQEFKNCYGDNWIVYTYSFYNESGCFTIYNIPQREELDFYFSREYSNIREKLCEHLIDVSSVEKEIWIKNSKFLFIKNPFFWWSNKKVLKTMVEVIKNQIKKRNEFYGVKVIKKDNK